MAHSPSPFAQIVAEASATLMPYVHPDDRVGLQRKLTIFLSKARKQGFADAGTHPGLQPVDPARAALQESMDRRN